jgi:RimJ/RimL family protein N-acetyltransferase
MLLPLPDRFEAPRVVVRPVEASDLSALLAVNGDAPTVQYLPYAQWQSLGDGEAWLQRMRTLEAGGTARQYVIARREDDEAIGTVLLFRLEAASARAEIGYVISRAHAGRGLMREALQGVCAALFDAGLVRRFEAEVNPDNLASGALLKSLGFTREGRLRQRWAAKGRVYDVDAWGLLAGELIRR